MKTRITVTYDLEGPIPHLQRFLREAAELIEALHLDLKKQETEPDGLSAEITILTKLK